MVRNEGCIAQRGTSATRRQGKRFVVVHNIPSPYRLHLFRHLAAAADRRGMTFAVEFMAAGHQDRAHWAGTNENHGFDSRTWCDRGATVGGTAVHWNPALIGHLREERPDYLMVGGAWDSATALALTAIRPCGALIGWLEGNVRDLGRARGAVGGVKRWLLRRPVAFAVPGRAGADFLWAMGLQQQTTRVLTLPNIADETIFKRCDPLEAVAARRRLGLPEHGRVALWPARLIEAKNIQPVLNALAAEDINSGQIVLIGDGPLRESVVRQIASRGLAGRVELRPSVPYADMPFYYRAADVFMLPSLHDPNPLSVVEALHCGLPVILSTRLGNADEAIPDEKNGWRVDPFRPETVRQALLEAFSCEADCLQRMSHVSQDLARRTWSSLEVASNFMDGVMRLP